MYFDTTVFLVLAYIFRPLIRIAQDAKSCLGESIDE